ncbi:hypothetical protein LTS15_002910 [Exophiala xenobiotica]|nr:hypothetical protein LTS15_002910 [Exophiala xenobiotica]
MAHKPSQSGDSQPESHSFGGTGVDECEQKEVNLALLQETAWDIAKKVVTEWNEANEVSSIEFLAVGGYNRVWLTTYKTTKSQGKTSEEGKFVLRIPRRETPSLKPYQLRHEVGCLRFLEKNLPSIPAPRIYAWNDGFSNSGVPPFIAEEFMDGQRLSVLWPQLTEDQKTTIIREIANVVADLGETRFPKISGFTHDSHAGPTIEAAKVFNGRAEFHSPEYYNIGPYAEPRVLVHEDFHAGNILVRDGHLVGILDWEFSGVYPLSELLGPILILQVSSPGRDNLTEEEEVKWHERYLQEVESVVLKRGWSNPSVSALMGDGHQVLQKARSIMFPEAQGDGLEDEG